VLTGCGGGGSSASQAAQASASSSVSTAAVDPATAVATGGSSQSSASTSAAGAAQEPVVQGGPGTVTLTWQPPTEYSDGTPLTSLAGYDIYYGTASQSYSQTIKVSNPGISTYVVDNLPAGTYYFAIAAYDSTGEQSAFSPEVSAAVQ
jgi:hypothetical protein